MRWLKAGTARPDHVKPTTVVHDDVASVIGLHGHGGATHIEWVDELMHDDLRDLLDALGMFSGARPQAPHEVMREAIAEVTRRVAADGGVAP